MIKRIKGNLLHFPDGVNAILHGANTLNVMGAGIASQIKNFFPEAYEADTNYYNKCGGKIKLGTFSKCWVNDDHKVIYNLYSQSETGTHKRMVSYKALENGFKSIKEDLSKREWLKEPILGFSPEIGCGLAGGDKKIVLDIITAVFYDADFDVILVDYDG